MPKIDPKEWLDVAQRVRPCSKGLTTSDATIVPGTTLWWVTAANSNDEGEVTVNSIDGRHATLSNGVILDLDTMNAIPNPVPRGRCYLSRDEMLGSLRLMHEWSDFFQDLRSMTMPKKISIADIAAIRQLVGLGQNRRRR